MDYEINKECWQKCLICGKSIKEIRKERNEGICVYYTFSFKNHIESEHKITVTEYFEKNVGLNRPFCKCGICGKQVDIKLKGANFYWKQLNCGRNDGVKKWSEEAKISRKGSGNPMFNKIPWNEGLTKETNESIKNMAENQKGKIISDEHKKKISQAWKDGRITAGHNTPHSEATKELIRQKTFEQMKRGCFTQLKSKCHIVMSQILDSLNIKYDEEKVAGVFSFDFYLTDYDLYIEVDGDYFHSNPIMYPNGPVTKTQKINWFRDLKKNSFCQKEGMRLYRFWENDILNQYEKTKERIKEIYVAKKNS